MARHRVSCTGHDPVAFFDWRQDLQIDGVFRADRFAAMRDVWRNEHYFARSHDMLLFANPDAELARKHVHELFGGMGLVWHARAWAQVGVDGDQAFAGQQADRGTRDCGLDGEIGPALDVCH